MRILILFFIIISLPSCKKKLKVIPISSFENIVKLEEALGYERTCEDPLNYAPDEFTETRTIRVNVHFLNDLEGRANFSLAEGKEYFGKMLRNSNKRLGENQKMNLPVGNDTPVLDPSFRYKIVGISKEDDGFYSHRDSVHYYFMNKGRKKNNYSKAVTKKYAINDDKILNIFSISHPQDSLESKTYKAFGTGIALGNSLKISGIYSNRTTKPWGFATLMNHEIGHVLGLAHAWTRYDGCDDTPVHPNCWDKNSPPPCDGTHSNNVMDYNNQQMAYSPCQLGKIHKGFNTIGARTRGLIFEDWCKPISDEQIIISDHLEWKGHRDLRKDIIIKAGGILHIHCRLSLAADRKIIVEEGGQLHIHQYAKLHNSCGDKWGGIEIHSRKDTEDQLFIYGNAKIEDLTESSSIQSKVKL